MAITYIKRLQMVLISDATVLTKRIFRWLNFVEVILSAEKANTIRMEKKDAFDVASERLYKSEMYVKV
jgi:branched-subunit amino acid transport protein